MNRNFDELEGLKMILLANSEFDTLSRFNDSYVYVRPNDDKNNDEEVIFKNQLNKFISKEDFKLRNLLREYIEAGWNLNIKIFNEFAITDMIRFFLNSDDPFDEEILMLNHSEWIYKL